jgi:hypothetical protein
MRLISYEFLYTLRIYIFVDEKEKKMKRAFAAIYAVLMLSGCAHTIAKKEWSGVEYFHNPITGACYKGQVTHADWTRRYLITSIDSRALCLGRETHALVVVGNVCDDYTCGYGVSNVLVRIADKAQLPAFIIPD